MRPRRERLARNEGEIENRGKGLDQVQREISFWKRLFRRRKWTRLRRSTLRRTITLTNTRGAAKAESALRNTTRRPLELPPFCFTTTSRTP